MQVHLGRRHRTLHDLGYFGNRAILQIVENDCGSLRRREPTDLSQQVEVLRGGVRHEIGVHDATPATLGMARGSHGQPDGNPPHPQVWSLVALHPPPVDQRAYECLLRNIVAELAILDDEVRRSRYRRIAPTEEVAELDLVASGRNFLRVRDQPIFPRR
jgi:hypothetical protein